MGRALAPPRARSTAARAGHPPAPGTRIRIRPLGPADLERYAAFVNALDAGDLYLRTMGRVAPPDAARMVALLDVDGRTRIALAAVADDAPETILGVVRAAVEDGGAEFALIVGSALKRRGLGERLLRALLERLRALGVTRVTGHTFAHNQPLLGLARRAGFAIEPGEDAAPRRGSATERAEGRQKRYCTPAEKRST